MDDEGGRERERESENCCWRIVFGSRQIINSQTHERSGCIVWASSISLFRIYSYFIWMRTVVCSFYPHSKIPLAIYKRKMIIEFSHTHTHTHWAYSRTLANWARYNWRDAHIIIECYSENSIYLSVVSFILFVLFTHSVRMRVYVCQSQNRLFRNSNKEIVYRFIWNDEILKGCIIYFSHFVYFNQIWFSFICVL